MLAWAWYGASDALVFCDPGRLTFGPTSVPTHACPNPQLGLPKALAQTGWTGILLMVLAGVVAVYTGKILVRSLYAKYVKRICKWPKKRARPWRDR